MGAPTPAPAAARPMGITILAVLAAIGGVLEHPRRHRARRHRRLRRRFDGYWSLLRPRRSLPAFHAGAGVASLAFAYGAWTLKPWAWPLGVGLGDHASLALWAGLAVISGGDISGQIIGVAISAIILYYLFQPSIKVAFGRA